MIWRYDPMLFSRDHTPVWHREKFKILGDRPLRLKKDKNQRNACGCAVSVDIGCYDACRSRCAIEALEDVVKTRLL
ncbi:DUF1848 domain-containing protein [Lacrimispora sp. NSJ-141]|uniref:DUF1848 domain-containing protein n=1 Tax=Lientehia hominis TaxID=2897778 RepID=A0AAP2RI55_9FIRM|nr:DUF1848 family protein [Lientehia hominis]MCD2492050.1 DUF1848 domain-containing protein [Lientehia hominis]